MYTLNFEFVSRFETVSENKDTLFTNSDQSSQVKKNASARFQLKVCNLVMAARHARSVKGSGYFTGLRGSFVRFPSRPGVPGQLVIDGRRTSMMF